MIYTSPKPAGSTYVADTKQPRIESQYGKWVGADRTVVKVYLAHWNLAFLIMAKSLLHRIDSFALTLALR